MDKYEVRKSDLEGKLCMLLACKNHEASYARLILDKSKSSKPDFNRLCNDISEIERLTKSRNKGCSHNKEVNLSSVDANGTFNSKCFNCGKVCGYWAKECRKFKGDLKGGCTEESEGGKTVNSGSNKMCNLLLSEGT